MAVALPWYVDRDSMGTMSDRQHRGGWRVRLFHLSGSMHVDTRRMETNGRQFLGV